MKQDKAQKFVFSSTNMVISLYLCFMLGVFPLLYKYQYAGMGDCVCIGTFFVDFCRIFAKGQKRRICEMESTMAAGFKLLG